MDTKIDKLVEDIIVAGGDLGYDEFKSFLKKLEDAVLLDYTIRITHRAIGISPIVMCPSIDFIDEPMTLQYWCLKQGNIFETKTKPYMLDMLKKLHDIKLEFKFIDNKVPAGMSPSFHHIMGKERKSKRMR